MSGNSLRPFVSAGDYTCDECDETIPEGGYFYPVHGEWVGRGNQRHYIRDVCNECRTHFLVSVELWDWIDLKRHLDRLYAEGTPTVFDLQVAQVRCAAMITKQRALLDNLLGFEAKRGRPRLS